MSTLHQSVLTTEARVTSSICGIRPSLRSKPIPVITLDSQFCQRDYGGNLWCDNLSFMKIGLVGDRKNTERTSSSKTVAITDSSFLECSPETEKQLRQYSLVTGVSMTSIVDEAIQDWLTCVAPARDVALQIQELRRRG